MLPFLRRLIAGGARFDAIDAHYFYPDGVAAVWLGRQLGLPVVVTARGTDINLIPRHAMPRRLIRRAMAGAAALVAVSAALKQAMVALGAPEAKITVLRNGVDTRLFRPPADRAALRAGLGLAGPTLLSVGHLIERKGHHLVIEALAGLPGCTLLVSGDGPERARLQSAAAGARPRSRPSARSPAARRDGASYTAQPTRWSWRPRARAGRTCCWRRWPVARRSSPPMSGATRRWSARPRPDGLPSAIRRRSARPLPRCSPHRRRAVATRAYAERFGWEETTAGQMAVFRRVVGRGNHFGVSPTGPRLSFGLKRS